MAKLDVFFKLILEHKASDLHLSVGAKPMLRKHGELEELNSAIP